MEMPALNVLIQINISDENSKSGITLGELEALAADVAALPRLTLRGLMAIRRQSQVMKGSLPWHSKWL